MNFVTLLLASAINLQCQQTTWDGLPCENPVDCDRLMEFTLDLDNKSGELKSTDFYEGKLEVDVYATDKLQVTPNYINFPFSDTYINIDRRNSTFALNRAGGVCKLVDKEEVERAF
ncbi:hypothetical protein [Myxosarcina sp. GI1]|uniref:hypothetical protein n=1 Tax=Myxosarcina sp. GI1 TaxID=1541065 RepID=UPI00056037E7|nr:hypothetical protein [Myxosarcina sp. GI1]